MEEEVQQTDDSSIQEGMPKVYKYLIIGIVVAIVVIAGLVVMKFSLKTSSDIKDYNSDFEGFMSQAKTCEPSKVLYNVSANLFGLRNDTWTYEMRFDGVEDDACLFHMEIVDYFSDGQRVNDTPLLEMFKGLNKTCNIPLEMIETEFEYWKSGSPQAFSNKSYCVYTEQVTMNAGGQQTNNNACTESWVCSNWSSCGGGTQTRTCTDSNNCGTTTNKPSISRACQQEQTSPTSDECSGLPLWVQDSPNGVCTDSDNGKNYYIKGITSGPEWSENRRLQEEDVCGEFNWNSNLLNEFFCCNGFLYTEEYTCPNGCLDGACLQTARACKVMVNNVCQEYYLPDYIGCNSKSDCTSSCSNCAGGTQNCLDFGKWSSSSYDYSDYNHYYKCAECFGMSDSTSCKSGYKCSIDKCVPTLETECSLAVCENCLSGKRKYSSSGGVSICYDCDTSADCNAGFNCTMAECVAI